MLSRAVAKRDVLGSSRSAEAEDEDHHRLVDRAWIASVGGIDRVLRRRYQVCEYTTSGSCVLRIGLDRAHRPALLDDNTLVRVGDAIGSLHLWNEQLPRFPLSGPDLHWAKTMQIRVRHSLEELCDYVEDNPAWDGVEAFRAEIALSLRLLAGEKLRHVAKSYGFEAASFCDVHHSRLFLIAENMLTWGFARAYNPLALPRHQLFRGRQQLWLSRKVLVERYSRRRTDGSRRARS